MAAPARQRILRGLALMTLGTASVVLVSLDPARALREPALWSMWVALAAWTVVENLVLKNNEPPEYHGRLGTRLMQGAVVIALMLASVELFHMRGTLPRTLPVHAAGIAILAMGIGIRIWSILALSDSFRYELRVETDQRLIERGPYAHLRHPSYLGILLITVGAALSLYSVVGAFAGALVVGAITHTRILEEERVLRAAFGSEYDEYSARTWRLFPYVY